MKWSTADENFLKNNYPEKGGTYCANRLNRSSQTIHLKARKLKLKTNKGISRTGKKRGTYMEEERTNEAISLILPTTKEACYVLGFLWADGWITENKHHHVTGCSIMKTDFDVLEPIVLKTFKWKIYQLQRKNRKAATTFKTNNIILFNFLKLHDYNDKSIVAPTSILSIIPENLKNFWWRGYFDGDGCFYHNKVKQASISGSYQQDWSCVEQLLQSLGCTYSIYKRINKKSSYSQIRMTNIKSITNFGNFLYSSSPEMGLLRKFSKFKGMVLS